MHAVPGVIVAMTILDSDIMTDLPTDSVAIVVTSGDTAKLDSAAILNPDRTGVVAEVLRPRGLDA